MLRCRNYTQPYVRRQSLNKPIRNVANRTYFTKSNTTSTLFSTNSTSLSVFRHNSTLLWTRFKGSKPNWLQLRNYASEVGNPLAMPALSPTMEKGNISSWKKKVGDQIETGDVLCEIETDKATVEFEAPEDGYLAAILVDAGSSDIPIGKPIGVMVDEESEISKVNPNDFIEDSTTDTSAEESQTNTASASQTTSSTEQKQSDTRQKSGVLSPAVRSLVETNNLDASLIPATGPKSRLLKGDVLKILNSDDVTKYKRIAKEETNQRQEAKTQPKQKPLTSESDSTKAQSTQTSSKGLQDTDFEDVPISQMRQVIAQRLVESKETLPHAYQTTEAQVDQVLSFRQKLKDLGFRVSVNDIIIKAAALALRDVPECNVINGQPSKTVDVSVAVATDRGLITPIVKNAAALGLSEISEKVKDLATRARENKLKPEEFQGGSFSISNLGMFGISEFKAVINPPQGLILAIGGTEQKVIMKDDPLGKIFETEDEYEEALDRAISVNNPVEVGNFMSASASLSNIHIDPINVSLFMNKFKKYLENPQTLVL